MSQSVARLCRPKPLHTFMDCDSVVGPVDRDCRLVEENAAVPLYNHVCRDLRVARLTAEAM